MKTITIHLTQEPTAGLFRVVRFTNTIQLSVGMIVPVARLEEWCAIPRVNVHIDGMTAPDADQKQTLLTEGEGNRVRTDALALPGEC